MTTPADTLADYIETQTADPEAVVRAAIGEHVPDELRGLFDAMVAGLRAEAEGDAKAADEQASARDRQALVVALAAAEASLNDSLGSLAFNEVLLAAFASTDEDLAAEDILRAVPVKPDWVIPGVVGRGWAVKFAGREKCGKGKLVWTCLGCLERGEPTVFGEATPPTTALIYTEEPEDSVREKIAEGGLAAARVVYGWKLAGLDWRGKVDRIVALALKRGAEIVYVDNISRAAGIEDEGGTELARAVEYLIDRCRGAGLTLLFDHHHKKGRGKLEDKSRGGTATAGATDNNVEIERMGEWDSRVRRISSAGRINATRWQRVIALAEDGTSYEIVADTTQPQGAEERRRLRALGDCEGGVTAPAFAEVIGKGEDTARRVLEDFAARGWARREGSRPVLYFPTGEGTGGLGF